MVSPEIVLIMLKLCCDIRSRTMLTTPHNIHHQSVEPRKTPTINHQPWLSVVGVISILAKSAVKAKIVIGLAMVSKKVVINEEKVLGHATA